VPPQDLIDRRREEILTAAEKVFAERGYHAANIADIAAELGMGHGTFYRYFGNKRDIAVHVVDRVVERIASVVADEDPYASSTLVEYRAQVVRIGHALFDVFAQNEHLAQLFFYEATSVDAEITGRVNRALDVFAGYTAQYLANGARLGFLRQGIDVEVTAAAINGMIFEGARRLAAADDLLASRERWVQAVTALMFDGIGPG